MAASATVTISGTVTGLPTGTKTLTGQLTSAAAVGEVLDVTLASGPNTITVPTGSSGVLISPPSGNVVALTIKGVSGDTGVGLSPTNPTWIALAPGTTTFVVTAASAMSAAIEFSFV